MPSPRIPGARAAWRLPAGAHLATLLRIAAIRHTACSPQSALAMLSSRERLRLRFGVNGDPSHTLEEIGRALSLTRERIRQIESVALRKLRAALAESST